MTDNPQVDTANGVSIDYKYLFEVSEQIRRFEIGLVWQRALYFWGFTAAIFVGYAGLNSLGDAKDHMLSTIVACFGLVCALGWTLSNRGSKFWFHVWEAKAEQAADRIFGTSVWKWTDVDKKNLKALSDKDSKEKDAEAFHRISKTLMQRIYRKDGLWGFWVRRFSVSRLSIMISDFVVLIWLLILTVEVEVVHLPLGSHIWIVAGTLAYLLLYFLAFCIRKIVGSKK